MVNVTEYLKKNGLYSSKIIERFLSLQRVKYFIGHSPMVISKRGRYKSHTSFTEELFQVFILWMERKPIPLLNRKEHEVSHFIKAYYTDAISQYKNGKYFIDWYIPSLDLGIEFYEAFHKRTIEKDNKRKSQINIENNFIVNEETVMIDLANLVKLFPVKLFR